MRTLARFLPNIHQILEDDRQAMKKQRHTDIVDFGNCRITFSLSVTQESCCEKFYELRRLVPRCFFSPPPQFVAPVGESATTRRAIIVNRRYKSVSGRIGLLEIEMTLPRRAARARFRFMQQAPYDVAQKKALSTLPRAL